MHFTARVSNRIAFPIASPFQSQIEIANCKSQWVRFVTGDTSRMAHFRILKLKSRFRVGFDWVRFVARLCAVSISNRVPNLGCKSTAGLDPQPLLFEIALATRRFQSPIPDPIETRRASRLPSHSPASAWAGTRLRRSPRIGNFGEFWGIACASACPIAFTAIRLSKNHPVLRARADGGSRHSAGPLPAPGVATVAPLG